MLGIIVDIETKDGWDRIRYVGPLNEDTPVHLQRLKGSLGPKVIFNFKDVGYINSSGIRAWVLFLRAIQPGRQVAFDECSTVVVTQLNMIPGFGQGVDVRSVYVPFACDNCDHAEDVLFTAEHFPATGETVPARTCPKCGDKLQLTDSLEDYFEFASRP